MEQFDLNDLFDKGMEMYHITNTAYPLTAKSVKEYALCSHKYENELVKKFLESKFEKIRGKLLSIFPF
ncbi:MAG: hypothetical protein LBQ28_10090 [Prevotellaceae bacterium]|jgi:hypothetical protein|nr:hypothetical protein [Prevotellaceae bacterium]